MINISTYVIKYMIAQVIREREKQKTDQQQRKWSRREEQNFLRTILAYGVEYSSKEARFVWDRFEQFCDLDC